MKILHLCAFVPKGSLVIALLESAVMAVVWHQVGFGVSLRSGIRIGSPSSLWTGLWSMLQYESPEWWSGLCVTFVTFAFLPVFFCVLVGILRRKQRIIHDNLADAEPQGPFVSDISLLQKINILTTFTLILAVVGYILRQIIFGK